MSREDDIRRVFKLGEVVLAMSEDIPDAIALCVGVIAEFARRSNDPREVMRIVVEQIASLVNPEDEAASADRLLS